MKDGSINIEIADKAIKSIDNLILIFDNLILEEKKLEEFGLSLEIKGGFKYDFFDSSK